MYKTDGFRIGQDLKFLLLNFLPGKKDKSSSLKNFDSKILTSFLQPWD